MRRLAVVAVREGGVGGREGVEEGGVGGRRVVRRGGLRRRVGVLGGVSSGRGGGVRGGTDEVAISATEAVVRWLYGFSVEKKKGGYICREIWGVRRANDQRCELWELTLSPVCN